MNTEARCDAIFSRKLQIAWRVRTLELKNVRMINCWLCSTSLYTWLITITNVPLVLVLLLVVAEVKVVAYISTPRQAVCCTFIRKWRFRLGSDTPNGPSAVCWSLWLLDAYPVLVQSMKRQLRLCSRCCNHYTQMMCYREVGAFLLLRLIKNPPHVVCVTGKGASASVQWQQSKSVHTSYTRVQCIVSYDFVSCVLAK